jgi:RNA recognition motif-containing protein
MEQQPVVRKAGGKVWKDSSLSDWPENDYRIFVGNLGTEVGDEMLSSSFRIFKSFQKSRVIRDRRTLKSKGFGFVSFADPNDMIAAIRDVNGKYIGNRPCMLKRSKWEDRNIDSEKNLSSVPLEHVGPFRNPQKFRKSHSRS